MIVGRVAMVVKKAATRAAAAIVVVVRGRMVALRVVAVRATAARVVVARERVAGEMGDRRNRPNPTPNCHYLSLIQPHSAHVVQSAIRRRGRHLPSLHHRSRQCCQAAAPQAVPYAIGSAAYGMQTYLCGGGRRRTTAPNRIDRSLTGVSRCCLSPSADSSSGEIDRQTEKR